ncbi:hypothetical protein [Novosphingobium sp. PASSN1]|uniref:hypothetical protein n=1 Tax=Novosphingobium sp. PASSN1 TaxID=2015561 RepID=UPI000BD63F6B|nr:hypothetical protein [Novosphingobium sp. PASSN1]OYU36090.1 MAG: hypothetical protein CFE35_07450 [Novosphingobium sp. PASSN1]
MAVEASDVAVDLVVAVDPVPADDAVLAIDPVEYPIDPVEYPIDPVEYPIDLGSIAIAEPQPEVLPIDESTYVPVDAQSFGGPVDAVPADDGAVISYAGTDGGADGQAGPVDDGGIFTTTFIDGSPVDVTPVDVTLVDEIPTDGGSDEVIDRPVDPMPNWRTFGGEVGSADGTTDGDTDSVPTLDPILDKDPGVDATGAPSDTGTDVGDGTETPDDVIYTLDPNDPLIYANMASGETPGRPADPLPFERTNSTPAADLTAPDTASDVVHYAAAEPFHTGLDLL